ncbi:hypothetical protein ACGC1H_000474 [Rhizoctonia solani]
MQDNEVIIERIENLLSAFETTAQVIRQIGHKNWLRALLDADRDAIQAEHCHRCLTDLMFLFNIEQNLDQWNMQRENERARKRDHHNLLRVTHSVQSELTTQGEIIGDVLEMVRTLSQSPTFNVPARGASQDSITNCTYHGVNSPNTRNTGPGRPESSMLQSIPERNAHREGARNGSNAVPRIRIQRRGSWMDKFGLQKISAVRLSILGVSAPHMTKTRGTDCSKPVGAKSPPTLASPKYKFRSSKVSSKGLSHKNTRGSTPHRGRKHASRQLEASQVTSLAAPFTCAPRTRLRARSPSSSPCGSKYVEVRYYSGDMASGVLLSKVFASLGKTTIGELRRANSHPTHPNKLSRLNEGNFVMEIPDGIHPTNILNVSPWTDNQGPPLIVWVLVSCGMHLESVKLSTAGGSKLEWALIPCATDTLVQDVTSVIGKLTSREIAACYRRDGHQTYQMDQNQLLRDCAVGRGMYLEVEIIL